MPGGDHVQAGDLLNSDRRFVGSLCSRQAGAEATAQRNAEIAMNRGTAHIRVDQQNFLAGLGEDHGEVKRIEALAFLHHGAGHHNDLGRSSGRR